MTANTVSQLPAQKMVIDELTMAAMAKESREHINYLRVSNGLEPATFNYQDPTREMLQDLMWNAIWDEIKTWDINVPSEYHGFCGATGNHATAIYLAIHNLLSSPEAMNELIKRINQVGGKDENSGNF